MHLGIINIFSMQQRNITGRGLGGSNLRAGNYYSQSIDSSSPNNHRSKKSSNVLKGFQDQLYHLSSHQDTKNKAFRLRKELIRHEKKDKQQIRSKLQTIKHQLELKSKKEQIEKRLSTIISEHSNSLEKKRKELILPQISNSMLAPPYYSRSRYPTEPAYYPSSPVHLPIYPQFYPMPQPYPHYFPNNQQQSEEDSEQSRPRKPRKNRKLPKKKEKYVSKQDRQKNRERLKKIMKKCFRAVAYIVYLKKLTKDIMKKRKTLFDKYWPQNFQKSSIAMRQWFSSNCKKFFDQMTAKKDIQINIEGDEDEQVLLQKKKMVKGLVGILVGSLNNLVDDPTFDEICQILLLFCKHGAFVENGVLTPEEAETVVFSEVHGYLRMNTNLQKSQIVNFLFMKIILYNMLLQPWKYSAKFQISQNHQAYQNFYFISSVFYQIVSEVQNSYLQESPQNFQTGNWRTIKAKFQVKLCPPLVHLENNYEQGEIISGMVPEKILDNIFDPSFWRGETELIKGVIDKMHEKLRKTHWKLINTVYPYKDMSHF